MADKEDEGKLELSVRILGNEIIGFKMIVDEVDVIRTNSAWCYSIYNGFIRTTINGDI